jgi:hypothetical protein
VPSSSAIMGVPNETSGSLYASHRSMARFSSSIEINFQRVLSILVKWIDAIVERSEGDKRNQLNRLYGALLSYLDVKEARQRRKDVDEAYSGTYDWIFSDEIGRTNFLSGKQQGSTYRIQGLLGSGKYTAMKFALEDERLNWNLLEYNSDPWVITSYFFHDRGTSLTQKSIEGFLKEV